MKQPIVLCAVLTALAAVAPAPAIAQDAGTAQAPASVSAEVIVLHATNAGSGIDPRIGNMPQLRKPPFSSYNSYTLLDRPKLALSKGQATTTKLPNGRVMSVTLKEVVPAAKKGDPPKYSLSTSIQNPSGNKFLPGVDFNSPAGETFFVAGQTYKGGILVIGIKVLQ